MNTRLSLVVPEVSEDLGYALLSQVRRHVDNQEELMSRFRQGPLAKINMMASDEAVHAPDELWTVLIQCRHHWELTGGLFDIAQGRAKTDGTPTLAGDLGKVVFDDRSQTARFALPGLILDLGGIGKGLALKGVENILHQAGVEQAFVSFGESSILALGEHPNGGPWRVGLAGGLNEGFMLVNEAMSISGQSPGSEHIIDPHTGEWATGPQMVAVASECPVEAEVLSTALFIATPAERRDILVRYSKVRVLEVPQDFVQNTVNNGERPHDR